MKMNDIENTEDTSFNPSSDSLNLRIRILCKTIFFIMYAIVPAIEAYQNIFLVSIGFTVSRAGFVTGLCFISSLIAGPCWGALADKTGYRKTIFTILCLVILITFFPLPLIARELQTSPTLLNISHTNVINIESRKNTTLNFTSGKTILTQTAGETPIFFNVIAAILITGYTSLFTMVSFVDSTAMNVLQTLKSEEGYGKQRMFGALGIGVTVLLCGYVVDNFEHPTLSKFIAIYFVLLPYMMIGLPLTLLLFRYTSWENPSEKNLENKLLSNEFHETPQDEISSNSFNASNPDKSRKETIVNSINLLKPRSQIEILKEVFSNADNVFLMATVLVIGSIRSVFFSFLFLFLKDEMNGTKTSMGVCMFANSISAFIMFFYTKRLISFLGGPFIAVSIGIFAWTLRLLLTSFMNNQWLAALPQMLQSFSFALYWSAQVQHVNETAPKEVYITMFSILVGLNFGGAGFLANVIGGRLYKMYGGRVLFRGSAILAFCWLLLILMYHYRSVIFKKAGKHESNKSDTINVMRTENV